MLWQGLGTVSGLSLSSALQEPWVRVPGCMAVGSPCPLCCQAGCIEKDRLSPQAATPPEGLGGALTEQFTWQQSGGLHGAALTQPRGIGTGLECELRWVRASLDFWGSCSFLCGWGL